MDLFEGLCVEGVHAEGVCAEESHVEKEQNLYEPLASRMRPRKLDELIGQECIVGPEKLLNRLIQADRIGSIILYGPPGTGKTSLANIISESTGSKFKNINAVTSNVAELRKVIDTAKKNYRLTKVRTILFVDEIHRFNKAQQDVLLPDIEQNNIGFIGATTHNPCIALTTPLVSRSNIFQLQLLSVEAITKVLKIALSDKDKGYGQKTIFISDDVLKQLAIFSDGDARKALNTLELAVLTTDVDENGCVTIKKKDVEESIQKKFANYDKDDHFDVTSAFIKSMRGSDPDAAVYWMMRMIESGEDPRFIARRVIIFASEDIGNADPNAINVAVSALQALEFIGMPEAKFALTQAVIYVATAPKSNSVTIAMNEAESYLKKNRVEKVPDHLKDTHYQGAERLGAGKGYRYPHDYPDHFVKQQYRGGTQLFYFPSDQGYEKEISKRLTKWRSVTQKNC